MRLLPVSTRIRPRTLFFSWVGGFNIASLLSVELHIDRLVRALAVPLRVVASRL
jgi:hypothetical protein